MADPISAAANPEQSQEEQLKNRRIQNAMTFLSNPQVRSSPLSRRVNFLKSKGLTAEEIVEAFNKAGQSQSLESIQNIINNQNASATAVSNAVNVAQQPVAPQQTQSVVPQAQVQVVPQSVTPMPQVQGGAPHQPQYVAQHSHSPYPQQQVVYAPLPAPPTQPPPSARSWKDYFIMGTIGAVGSYAVFKAAENFLPYKLVRKDEQANLSSPGSRRNKSRRQKMSSSESDDAVRENLPLPKPPKIDAEKYNECVKKVETLTAENEELKEKLESERKEKAELSGLKGRLQGQILLLNRNGEKSSNELAKLVQELATANGELERLKQEKTTPPEEPTVKEEEVPVVPQEKITEPTSETVVTAS